jgi:hypothetical protein
VRAVAALKKLLCWATKQQKNITPPTVNKQHLKRKNIFSRIFYFYYDGFRSMTIGKKLWSIILIKLFIMFVVLKLFFFPDFLKSNFENDEQRGDYVIEQLTKSHK